ncbi:MAG TPA: glycosyltransferase [Marinobacter sp.]|uniref:glycosyltransferase n=1 Tax=Marinobacter sp. TaxID=50741 RepID=UPI002D806FA3|nr:glycosyltransferase [Marinobacter sp.]HET8800077.1 glycosyltransferase [Marinobacter sp.]
MSENANLDGHSVLFISYFYPPIESTGVPGSMRTLKFIRNLYNGTFYVLTKKSSLTEEYNAMRHLTLPVNGERVLRTISLDIFHLALSLRKNFRFLVSKILKKNNSNEVHSVLNTSLTFNSRPARSQFQRVKDFIYDLCYFPDQAGPWILPAIIQGVRTVRKHNISVVFATGSPWSGLVSGYVISRLTGKPLIVDFRDPWMNNPFHQSKGKLLDDWSARLERRVVRHASAVSLNTHPLQSEFLQRYPDIPATKFFVMPNGFDPADFEDIEPEPRTTEGGTLLLCHAGFLYGVRDPAVLLEAIRKANTALASLGKRITFRQIGDVNLGYDITERFSDLISDGSLILDPARPYKECLSALASADIVVNVQPGTRTQVPSKLYDYLAINKPILNITSPDGALGELVLNKQLGDLVSFDQEAELTELLVAYGKEDYPKSFPGYENRDEFSVSHISSALAERIVQCAETRPVNG